MKVLISAPICGVKQYSINQWLQWIADQNYKNYDFALCVNGEGQEDLLNLLKQVEITDIHQQVKKPILLVNELKEGVETSVILNITHARESLRQYALNNGYDKIFFLDTDTIPLAKDTIQKLIDSKEPAISGLYFYKESSVPVAVSRKRATNPTLEDLREAVETGTFIDTVIFGLGCALIDRTVFEKIPFDFAYFGKEKGEDYGYCFAMEQLGINRYLDPKLVCLHLQDKQGKQSQSFFTPKD
jgi:hypothetical protein